MALEEILQSMEEQAEQAEKQILAEAQAESDRIVAEGKRRAGDIYSVENERILAPLRAERTRIVNEARLELQHALQERKEALWTEALQQAREQLAGMRAGGDYSRVFLGLMTEALDSLGQDGGEVVLEVSPQDKAVAETAASQSGGRQVKVEAAGECLGGLTAFSPENQIRVINTLDSRLERVTSSQISELAAKLFGTGNKAEG